MYSNYKMKHSWVEVDLAAVAMGDDDALIDSSKNESITADGGDQLIGTIGYEIVCGISKKEPRSNK